MGRLPVCREMDMSQAADQTEKSANNIKVAVIQQPCPDMAGEAMALSAQLLREAAANGAQLALLPEIHAGHYFCQQAKTEEFERAESIPGPTTNALATLAKELKLVIVGSVFERRMAGVYHNTAVVLDNDGSLAGLYRKMHIPDDPGYYEKFYFTPGDAEPGFQPIQTSLGKLGVLVCWDQWYPEAARLMALAGADLLLYPTAIGWDPSDTTDEQQRQRDAWQAVQRGHAVANHLPVLTANRIGEEPDPAAPTQLLPFWGGSFIYGPQGEALAQAQSDPQGTAEILYADISLNRTEELRRIWPFFRDRRIDAYGRISHRA